MKPHVKTHLRYHLRHSPNRGRQAGGVIALLLLWCAGLALVFYICVMRDLPRLQARLLGQVNNAVTATGVINATVTLDGRDVNLAGEVTSPAIIGSAGVAAHKVSGVRQVNNQLSIMESEEARAARLQQPELNILIAGDKVSIYGLISTAESSALIEQGVQQSYPSHTVENIILVSVDTTEPVWIESTLSALSLIKRVNNAELIITDNQIAIRGEVESMEEMDAVVQGLSLTYAAPLELINEITVVEPTEFIEPTLIVKLLNSELTLSGQMHSSSDLEQVASSAMGAFELNLVNNELLVNPDVAQALWLQQTIALLPQLKGFNHFELTLTADEGRITGEVNSEAQRQVALNLIDSSIGKLLPVAEVITIATTSVIEGSNNTAEAIKPTNTTTTASEAASAATDTLTQTDGTTRKSKSTSDTPESTEQADKSTTTSEALDGVADGNEPTDETARPAENATDLASTTKSPSDRTQPIAETLDKRKELGQALGKLNLTDVRFETNSAILIENSKEVLLGVASALVDFPSIDITITGHTDSVGPINANLRLSQERADAVRAFLVTQGIPERQLNTQGYGESNPIADNNSSEGRAVNRRIEFNY